MQWAFRPGESGRSWDYGMEVADPALLLTVIMIINTLVATVAYLTDTRYKT